MRLKLRSSWLVSTPAAYTWFLSNRRRKLMRPLLHATGTINPTTQHTLLLGLNQRFWQPRLAPQTKRTQLFITLIAFGGLLWSVAKGLTLTSTQALNVYSLLQTLHALMQSPLALGAVLTLVILRRGLIALVVALVYILIARLTTMLSPSMTKPTQEKATNQLFTAAAPAHNHILLARSIFRLSKGLALLEPRPMPAYSVAFGHLKPTAPLLASAPVTLWVRFSGLTGVMASFNWSGFSHHCIERAVAARLLAANWAGPAEKLRSAPAAWTSVYPLPGQLQFNEVRMMSVRDTYFTEFNHAAAAGPHQYTAAPGLCTPASFYMLAANTTAEQALTFVQAPLVWAPLRVVKVNWA